MAKKVIAIVIILIVGGMASAAPPVGTALGPHGIYLMGFVKEYNARTATMMGQIVPCEVTIYADSSFTFVLKTPPAADLLRQAAGIKKGSGEPNKEKVGTVTMAQLKEIAEVKMKDLNAYDVDQAAKIIAGTARSMGLVVKE